jgi:hypothetical protein
MAGLLAAALVAVVLYCLARTVVPALRPAGHRRDLDAFHVAMGTAMVAMLVAPPSPRLSILTIVVAAAGLGWGVARLLRRAGTAYLRLAVGSGAMVGMVLLPATAATAAGADRVAGGHGHGGAATGPELLVPLLLVALMVVVAGRMLDAAWSRSTVPARLDACCDVAMAGSMGIMLALMV